MEIFQKVKEASKTLVTLDSKTIHDVLVDVSEEILKQQAKILEENQKDLDRMDQSDPKYDRLMLTPERLEGITLDMRKVAEMPDPVGEVIEQRTLPNGLKLSKRSVPLGVVGVIFEARPNVTFDVFSLCFKSHNGCILKGGSDAVCSNQAALAIIRDVLSRHNLNPNAVALLGREATQALLEGNEWVDVIIPRGSSSLIEFVRTHATVPVIETGAGIVHCYVDESCNLQKSQQVILNSKTRRVSVCNALDTLLIHKNQLNKLAYLVGPCAEQNVVLYADTEAYKQLQGQYPDTLLKNADISSYGQEFLDYKMALKVVDSLDDALSHINQHSSKHTEAILSDISENINKFLSNVDAAVVMANASTGFTDGAQFGLGAEIGISTQKIHARGPMGLHELTSYKWIVEGDGQIRP